MVIFEDSSSLERLQQRKDEVLCLSLSDTDRDSLQGLKGVSLLCKPDADGRPYFSCCAALVNLKSLCTSLLCNSD